MIIEQKKLLAALQSAENELRDLCGRGMKLDRVYRRVSDARAELEYRVNWFERNEPAASAAVRKPPAKRAENP